MSIRDIIQHFLKQKNYKTVLLLGYQENDLQLIQEQNFALREDI